MNVEKPKWLTGTDVGLSLIMRNPSFGLNQLSEKTLLQKRTQHLLLAPNDLWNSIRYTKQMLS